MPGAIWAGTLLRKDAVVGLLGAATLLYFGAVALVLRAGARCPIPSRGIWWVVGCEAGLDKLRVSLDAADAATYTMVRGKPFFERIVREVGLLMHYQACAGAVNPRLSLWLTGMKETVQQVPEFVRLAARMGVREVHLQRLVFDEAGVGMARAASSLFEATRASEHAAIAAAEALGAELGVKLDASGATEPELSLKQQGQAPARRGSRPFLQRGPKTLDFTALPAFAPAMSPAA